MHFEKPIIAEDSSKSMICKKYNRRFTYKPEQVQIHYHIGYDTKTIICPYCERVHILGYREQYGFDVNNDKRFYI